MSIVVSSPAQIHNSPLNNSTAKAQYSFPKAKRDDLVATNANSLFYDLPPVRSARAAGIGYGHKYDFTKGQQKSPAPNAYEPKGTLDDMRKKKGFTFGLSREAMAVTGGMMAGDRMSPGPGAYNIRGLNQKNIAYSFRSKTTQDLLVSNRHVPGPGAYHPPGEISKDGKYFVSKFKNTGAIANMTSQRGGLVDTKNVPGPGAYNPKISLSLNGQYFITGFKSSLARSFGQASLKGSGSTFGTGNNVPGPGSYRLPSEFGYYESKNAKEFDATLSQRS
eukprot:CAMPEP_0176442832 /NCGR_PEP_ID=MMETSP0127-20121128/22054_1 /TAXON_ID=938130 /ORGANISM="Platyophrya macrostoma, Strain WH" /LENGTH=276 /DNA_ID=CAMNT_0017827929 /DNA_START=23 /DNA_END=850 /DNA_ORIENTATION=+